MMIYFEVNDVDRFSSRIISEEKKIQTNRESNIGKMYNKTEIHGASRLHTIYSYKLKMENDVFCLLRLKVYSVSIS